MDLYKIEELSVLIVNSVLYDYKINETNVELLFLCKEGGTWQENTVSFSQIDMVYIKLNNSGFVRSSAKFLSKLKLDKKMNKGLYVDSISSWRDRDKRKGLLIRLDSNDEIRIVENPEYTVSKGEMHDNPFLRTDETDTSKMYKIYSTKMPSQTPPIDLGIESADTSIQDAKTVGDPIIIAVENAESEPDDWGKVDDVSITSDEMTEHPVHKEETEKYSSDKEEFGTSINEIDENIPEPPEQEEVFQDEQKEGEKGIVDSLIEEDEEEQYIDEKITPNDDFQKETSETDHLIGDLNDSHEHPEVEFHGEIDTEIETQDEIGDEVDILEEMEHREETQKEISTEVETEVGTQAEIDDEMDSHEDMHDEVDIPEEMEHREETQEEISADLETEVGTQDQIEDEIETQLEPQMEEDTNLDEFGEILTEDQFDTEIAESNGQEEKISFANDEEDFSISSSTPDKTPLERELENELKNDAQQKTEEDLEKSYNNQTSSDIHMSEDYDEANDSIEDASEKVVDSSDEDLDDLDKEVEEIGDFYQPFQFSISFFIDRIQSGEQLDFSYINNDMFKRLMFNIYSIESDKNIIWAHKENYEKAFMNFDIDHVKEMGKSNIDSIVDLDFIIEQRARLDATIINAQVLQDIFAKYNSFPEYCVSLKNTMGDFDRIAAKMKEDGFSWINSELIGKFFKEIGLYDLSE